MSGSLISVSYQRDSGQFYALNRDESNCRGIANDNVSVNTPLFLPPASPFIGSAAPKGFRERYANAYLETDPNIRRRFPIGNPAAISTLTKPGSRIFASIRAGEAQLNWIVTTTVGERNPRIPNPAAFDTGQTDGTPGAGITAPSIPQ